MRRPLILSLPLLLLVSVAHAQGNSYIQLFTDDAQSPCSLVDRQPGTRSIFMYQMGNEVVAASEFSVPVPACWTGASYVGEAISPALLAIGSTQTDLTVSYVGCQAPPVYIGHVDFYSTGHSPPCCVLEAKPSSAGLLVVNCLFETHEVATGHGVVINPDASCPCEAISPPPPPPVIPVPSKIEIFADAGGSQCSITDDGLGVRSVYVFHTGNTSATASEFSVPRPDCWTGATWVGDVIAPGFLRIGTAQTDLTIAYAGCVDLPVFIARVDFAVTGKAPPCCKVQVAPAASPAVTDVLEVTCDFETRAVGTGAPVVVNPPGSCQCDAPTSLRTESATWGKVKSLFRSR